MPDGVLALDELVHAVVEEGERHVLLEGRADQHHLERFERVDRAVGRLAVDVEKLLLRARSAMVVSQSPKTTRRSAWMPASISCPRPEMRKPGAMLSASLPWRLASLASRMPRRCAAAMQTTRSSLVLQRELAPLPLTGCGRPAAAR